MATSAPVADRPTVADSPRRHVLYQHFEVGHDRIGPTIRESFEAIYRQIMESGGVPAGPPFVIYHSSEPPWAIDVCAPVMTPMLPSTDVMYKEIPAGRVVSLVHTGPYDTLGAAYDAVQGFIRDSGLEPAGPPRESYLSPPDTPPERVKTIVDWPIR